MIKTSVWRIREKVFIKNEDAHCFSQVSQLHDTEAEAANQEKTLQADPELAAKTYWEIHNLPAEK